MLSTIAIINAMFFRMFGLHHIVAKAKQLPIIPASTVLMLFFGGIDWLRAKVRLGLDRVQAIWLLFCLWAVFSLLAGASEPGTAVLKFFDSAFFKDIIFCGALMLLVDRLDRYRALLVSMVLTITAIAAFALPQLWSPKECGEYILGDPAHIFFDGRACEKRSDCFHNIPKQRQINGIGERLFACERHGPLGINAFKGRVNWRGIYGHTNSLGAQVGLLTPFILVLLVLAKRRWVKVLWGTVMLVFLAMLYGSGSRGPQLAFVVSISVTAVLLYGPRALIAPAVLGALAMISMMVAKKTGLRGDAIGSSTEVSDLARREAGLRAYYVWSQFPIFGVGLDRFSTFSFIGTHNTYLEIMAELGIGGLLITSLLLWATMRSLIAARRAAAQADHRPLASWSAGAIGSFSGSLVTLALAHLSKSVIWMWTLSQANALLRSTREQLPQFRHPQLRIADIVGSIVTMLLILGLFYLVLNSMQTF